MMPFFRASVLMAFQASLTNANTPIAGKFFAASAAADGNPAMVNDPAKCAADLTAAVAAITSGSNSIVKGVANCPPKTAAGSGKDSACAANIITVTANMALASQKLSSASKSCANTLATEKGANCGEKISAAIKSLAGSSVCLISSTESCKTPEEGGSPFGCVVDVVDVVDSLANAALNINNAVDQCRVTREPNPNHVYLYDTWMKTGCTVLPSPAWIQWGYWAENTNEQAVLTKMFDWCMAAMTGGHIHAARLCCNELDGKCEDVQCNVQSGFTGPRPMSPAAYIPSREIKQFPRDLE